MFLLKDILIFMGFAWMLSGFFLLKINRERLSISYIEGTLVILAIGLTLLDNLINPTLAHEEPLLIPLLIISRNSYYLVGPSLWLYTRVALNNKKLNRTDLLHLIPFVIMCIIIYATGSFLLTPNPPPPVGGIHLKVLSDPEFYRVRLSIVSRWIYCFMVFKTIRKHMKEVPEFYSSKTFANTLSWLYNLVIFYLFLYIINFTITLLRPEIGIHYTLIVSASRIIPSLLFMFFFIIFAPNQPVPEDKQIEVEKPVNDSTKYKTSGFSNKESRSLFNTLTRYILDKRLFTDPDLTLNSLAESVNETRHHISEVINRETGGSFYNYINNFRHEEFLKCLKEDRYPNLTISAIAIECGFKSNSVFYNIFKKKTGMTPVQYKKQLSA